jgi:hypothetical protein
MIWRELFIITVGRRLDITENQVIYSGNSGLNSAYNLRTLTNVASSSSNSEMDVRDSPLGTTTTPENRWTSPAGGNFVLAPTFDFDNASDSLVIRAYNLANKRTVVSNFKVGDVILTN